ncbi:alpha/beta hydrolase [Myroides sp. NP-2]|uniref:alpha/beta hydrolase n=1 Tax=Myroides sp. NP-2 TaxID=2759945 RepID=UPI0015FE0AA1|nr:alpha/beta hydrolase [Myroides sp. NP-2]MBB1150300.1 alpha/beta hydrolase [Myroides sp. NP-2]
MKAFIHFFIYLLTTLCALMGFAQAPQTKEITIDSQLIGDLYSRSTENDDLVIIVPGSGPTNRNGNSHIGLKGDSYKMLATALSTASLDVFTYDKRIIAQLKANQVKEEDSRFEDGVADLALIVDYFAPLYSRITLVGHSEGALLANLLANKSTAITKYVSLAGVGTTADQIIYDQIMQQLPILGPRVKEINSALKRGETVDHIPPMLMALYRPSVQPYLISWMKYDPSEQIQKVKQPTLIIDGDKDLQVPVKQGDLLSQANSKAKRATLKNMNHVLKQIEKDEDNMKSYGDPSYSLHPELVPTLVSFILTP